MSLFIGSKEQDTVTPGGTDTRATFPEGEDEGLGSVMMDNYPQRPPRGPQTSGNKGLTGAQPAPVPHLAGNHGLGSFAQQLLFVVTSAQNFGKGERKPYPTIQGASVYYRAIRDAQGCVPHVGQQRDSLRLRRGGSAPRESRLSLVTASLFRL